MEKSEIILLNKNEPLEIEAYEKELYFAFSRIVDPSLDLIWDIDHSRRRIKTRIDYSDQQIMVVRFYGKIIAGSAINLNMQKELQLEKFGFSIDKEENSICEALLLFSNQLSINESFSLNGLRDKLFEYLKGKNLKKVYSTCSQKRVRSYRFLGFRDIDMRIVNGQNEYLLTISV